MPYPLPFVNTYFAESRRIPPFERKYTKSRDDSRQKEGRIAPSPAVDLSVFVVFRIRFLDPPHTGFLFKPFGEHFCRQIG